MLGYGRALGKVKEASLTFAAFPTGLRALARGEWRKEHLVQKGKELFGGLLGLSPSATL